ncbi:MAG: hypothetical protein QM770_20745 [Tepidisphaeraceae bacterium]
MGPINDDEPWPLERCPNCGYSMVGLPRGHACPECGESVAPDEIVLWGFGHGSLSNHFTSRTAAGAVGLLLVINSATLSQAVLTWVRGYRWAALALVAVPAVLIGWVLRRRHLTLQNGDGLVQVRISPAGLGQSNGKGRPKLQPWSNVRLIETGVNTQGHKTLTIRKSKWQNSPLRPAIVDVSLADDSVPMATLQRRIEQLRDRARGRMADQVNPPSSTSVPGTRPA